MAAASNASRDFRPEIIETASLRPCPRNYRSHPEDQIVHLIESIRRHGFYRNIVIARDGTILAGHGVVEAARRMGIRQIPVIRLDLDPNDPAALKVLTADNELGHLAERDDRALTELLKEIAKEDVSGLLGTGYDEMMLANLIFVTRPASEIGDMNAAAQWVGLPEYEEGSDPFQLILTFPNEEERLKLMKMLGVPIDKKVGRTWSTRYPFMPREDKASIEWQT